MSDLFDDVRKDLPDWYQSDLERVVDSPFASVLSKGLSNFNNFHRDYSHRYNKVLNDEVKILPNESKSQALSDIKDSFSAALNKSGGFLDIAENNIREFRNNLRQYFFKDENLLSKLPDTDDLTEPLHLPKILLRDNKSLDSVSYSIYTTPYGSTRELDAVKLIFKSQEDESLKCELTLGPYLDLPTSFLKLPDSELVQSVLKTLQKPNFFNTIENLIQNDVMDKIGKFDKMRTNFESIKQALNNLDNDKSISIKLKNPKPLTGIHIPDTSLVHTASLVYSKELGKCAISLPQGHEALLRTDGLIMHASTKADKDELLITSDSKWSDFLATNSVKKNFHMTDDPLKIQAMHKVFLMYLLKNDDLVDNLNHFVNNSSTLGEATIGDGQHISGDYFELQSKLNQPKEKFLSNEDREQYEEDLKKIQSLEKSLKYAKEKIMKWDNKIDINRNNLKSALNEIKQEYAKLGIDIDVEMQNFIK